MSRGKIEFIDGDGLPDIAVDFGRDLSEIPTRTLKVRTSTGVYITKTLTVDDAAAGLGHFSFADGELPAGDHLFNIVTTELDGRQRSYPSSGSIPLLVRSEFSDSLRSNNRNGVITIRGEDTTLAIDVVQTDQRDGSLLLVGTPTDGGYTDGQAVIVVGDTIADAVDFVNVAVKANADAIAALPPDPKTFSDAQFNIFNAADNTKVADFDLSGIATGTTRTVAMPDSDVTLGPAGSSGEVQFNSAGIVGGDSGFFWDNTNKRLGIGAAPDLGTGLHVKTADTGLVTAHVFAGELIIEGGANTGIAVQSAAGGTGWLIFGNGADDADGWVKYDSSSGALSLGSRDGSRFSVFQAYVESIIPFRAPAGAVGTPGYAFGSDPNSGLHLIGADNIALVTAGIVGLSVEDDQTVVVGPDPASPFVGGLDIQDGGIGLLLGADSGLKARTDLTPKLARFGGAHYVNTEQPVALLSSHSQSGSSSVLLGGGFSSMNAATYLAFYTAANNTTTTGTVRLSINSTGRVIMGSLSGGTGVTGLDVQDGNLALLIGADSSTKTRTNSTDKHGRIGAAHYTNTEQVVAVAYCQSSASTSAVSIGGGTNVMNAATEVNFYTAPDTTTTTGAKRGSFDSAGGLIVPGQYSQGAITSYTPTGTTETIDWDSGNIQEIDLASATGNVTLTLSNPKIGAKYEIKVIQDATTPRNLIWPAAVKWPGGTAPSISGGAVAVDYIYLTYDGTNYGCRFEQNLS